MEILPYKKEHLYQIRCANLYGLTENDLTAWEGDAISVLDRGDVLAVFGIYAVERVGTAWALISESIKSRPMLLHRLVKRNIPIVMNHFSLAVIEATADDLLGREWLLRLGFRDEGKWMRLYERR